MLVKEWNELPDYMQVEEVKPYYEILRKKKGQLILKRIFDIICSSILIVLLSPALLFISIWIKLDSKGPVFYRQERITQYGKVFRIFKFRTMVTNADKIGTLVTTQNDSRITKVGNKIRKCRLDELPQLLNILKGDMSVIGNRPYLPREKKDMNGYFDEIVKTKPGLTGYWQISGRSKTDFKTRLKLESYYSNHMSLKMDIKIFFGTFSAVFGHVGAK